MDSIETFTKNTAGIITTTVIKSCIGIVTIVIIARILGPEGKGIYSLAMLLPGLIVTFANFGISQATVYHVARERYSWKDILGNNVLFSLGALGVGVLSGLIVAIFFAQSLFPNVAQGYLLLGIAVIPGSLFFSNLHSFFVGAQRFREYNLIAIFKSFLTLAFIVIALWMFKAGIVGALVANISALSLAGLVLFLWARKIADGTSFKVNLSYLREASIYGIQAHLGNMIGFLNYRIDMFLIASFLNPMSVGFYSIGVGLAEKLWLVSRAASTVLFPKVAGETDEVRRKTFTPLVFRTVFWITTLGAMAIFFLSRWIVEFLFSADFLPAVLPLRILLVGIVALSASRVLANDVAGRGRPILNTYVGASALMTNVALNLIWIPRYGIAGAAWASTLSYSVTLLARIYLYCQLSGNSWIRVISPQRTDWTLYRQTISTIGRKLRVPSFHSISSSSHVKASDD